MQLTMTSTFPERLRTILEETGIRQTDLCDKAGIGKSAMSQYLHGAFVPKQAKLSAIAEALDVSEGWLMGYDVPRLRRVQFIEAGFGDICEEDAYIEMRAPDDSMKGACIPRGARVLIKPVAGEGRVISDGEIVSITVEAEQPKLRIFHKDGNKLVLTSTDVNIAPQIFDDKDIKTGNLTINGTVSRVEIEF